MKNSQRASETQKIRQQINFIKTEISPKIVTKSIRSNPKALPEAKTAWIQRTVRVALSTGTAEFIDMTYGDVFKAACTDTTFPGIVKIRGMKVWNMTPAGATSGSLRVDLNEVNIFNNDGSIVEQTSTDWGTATSSPGLSYDIPDQFSAPRGSTSSGDVLARLGSVLSGFTKQQFVADVYVMIRY